MGYCMEQVGCNFLIAFGNIQGVIKAIKAVAEDTPENRDRMNGGHYSNDGWCVKSYSWCDMDKIRDGTTIHEVMEGFRWHPNLGEDGNVVGIEFLGEKLGEDEVLFEAIAPFVAEGSYISMKGENGGQWKWEFVNGKCIRKGFKLVEED